MQVSTAPMLPIHGILRSQRRYIQPAKMRIYVRRIAEAIRPRWDTCLRNAMLSNTDDEVDFYGSRTNPDYVARQLTQSHDMATKIELIPTGEFDAEISAAIVSASRSNWIYSDRRRRG